MHRQLLGLTAFSSFSYVAFVAPVVILPRGATCAFYPEQPIVPPFIAMASIRVRIISPAKVSQSFILEGEAEFIKRLKGHCDVERLEAAAKSRAKDEAQIKKQEAGILLDRVHDREVLIALDERGKSFTSPQFSKWIEARLNDGQSQFAFLLGGAFGLDPEVRARADLVLSLSTLTFPYQLARLVLVEQIYRAISLIRNLPYNK